MIAPEVKLNEFSKDEWWDVCELAAPHISREQFEQQWQQFHQAKQKKTLQ